MAGNTSDDSTVFEDCLEELSFRSGASAAEGGGGGFLVDYSDFSESSEVVVGSPEIAQLRSHSTSSESLVPETPDTSLTPLSPPLVPSKVDDLVRFYDSKSTPQLQTSASQSASRSGSLSSTTEINSMQQGTSRKSAQVEVIHLDDTTDNEGHNSRQQIQMQPPTSSRRFNFKNKTVDSLQSSVQPVSTTESYNSVTMAAAQREQHFPSVTSSDKITATSTPLLSHPKNRRQIKASLEDLDLTGISLAASNRHNLSWNESADTEIVESGSSPASSASPEGAVGGNVNFENQKLSYVSDVEVNSDNSDVDDDESSKYFSSKANSYQGNRLPQGQEDASPDIVEITAKFNKQQIDARKPLVKYIENPPVPPNPFGKKPPQKEPPTMSLEKINEFKTDVFKSAKLLADIIQEMPLAEDDHSEFTIPRQLRVTLFPHQVYGARWMCWREQLYPGGGILADEMGLGKTVMSITLILNSKNNAQENSENWFAPENKKLIPSRATLVVCPVGCIGQWESELGAKAKGLRTTMFHGPNRPNSAALLSQSDVVLTTYPTLSSEIPKPDDDPYNKAKSPLMRIQWERIILDEGHIIRNPKTHGALSACRLNAKHRWIVTGTPIHNKPEDFYSLIKFLRLAPFDDLQVWKFWIGTKTVLKGNMERLHTIGKALILRRTKEEVGKLSNDMNQIPPKFVEDVEVQLSESEDAVYQYLFDYAKEIMTNFLHAQQDRLDQMQNAANKFVAGVKRSQKKKNTEHEGNPNFSKVLVLLTRLRQGAVLLYLIKTMIDDDDDAEEDDSYDPVIQPISAQNPVFEQGYKSTKIRAVLEELIKLRTAAENRGEPMDKVIVVSQWTLFLDIFSQHLRKKGFTCAGLDGRMKVEERTEVMKQFNQNPKKPQILLLSITAGGVGLNLTGGNHVFFMEPHWNPQVELQAQDRVHRFGQTKPVYIKRFICKNSIEPRVLQLQADKLQIADGLLNNAKNSKGVGLNINDLKKLFDLV